MIYLRFVRVARIFSALTLATSLFASVSSAAKAEHKIITETPVDNLKVEVEDIAGPAIAPYQRIQLHITAEARLPSGQEEPVDIVENVVPVPIDETSSALSMTPLFRDGTTVIARERLADGAYFPIGHINSDQELVLDSKYSLSVVYRQYRYTLHDRIVSTVLGGNTEDFDSVFVRIVKI
ncbi:MAG: hypothetical protein FJ146_18895 [Deltaproteobacteria bacterium]|nr:hypothetical protein [Deltaproteobacteria bacterium]